MLLVRVAAVLLSCLLFSPWLHAQSNATLSLLERGTFYFGEHSQWLADPSKELNALDVLQRSDWQASDQTNPNFGFSDSTYWLRTALQGGDIPLWHLWIRYSLMDQITLYLCPKSVTSEADCQQSTLGDSQPFALNRDISHPNPIFSFKVAPKQSYWLLLKADTRGVYQFPSLLLDDHSLQQALLEENLLRGAYYTTLLVMAFFHLFLFFSSGQKSYLYYSGFVLAILLFHGVYEGAAFQWLWPNWYSINAYSLPVLFAITLLIVSLLVPSFLQLRHHYPAYFRLFRVYSALAIVSLLLLPLMSYQLMLQTYHIMNAVVTGSAIIVSLHCWWMGNKAARYFALAWTVFMAGMVVAHLRSIGLLPSTTSTLYAYQIGSFIEVMLLALALTERVLQRQREQRKSHETLMQEQQQALEHLLDYEDLYQNSVDGKFLIDSDGYFTRTNAAWRAMLGYTDMQFFEQDNPRFNSLFSEAKQRKALWKILKSTGRVQMYIASLTQPITGERIMVALTLRRGGSNDRVIWLGSGQDVTDWYLKDQALKQAQREKNQAMRQLVLGISQEMKAPAAEIREAEQALEDSYIQTSPEQRELYLQKTSQLIKEGSERLAELSKLMKSAVVKDNQYQEEMIDLRRWLEDWATEQTRDDEQLHLRTAVHSYLVDWPTYPEALTIALNQLLNNSREHNPKLHRDGQLKVTVDVRERGDFLELHYHDNGKGVPKEQRSDIFMPFFTTEHHNDARKGLGLYQTYNLLTELMQGHVEWTNEEGFSLMIRFAIPPLEKLLEDNESIEER